MRPLSERDEEGGRDPSGHGRLVIVEGAAGIGESNLLARVPAAVEWRLAPTSGASSRQLSGPALTDDLPTGAGHVASGGGHASATG